MSENKRILVVEDEPAEAEFVAQIIRGLGFSAEVVHDGPAALASITASRPDMVFLDALLPKLDGFAVLRDIRNGVNSDLPVVMMSGIYRKRSYLEEAIGTLGATAYLIKPLTVPQVWERLEQGLGVIANSSFHGEVPGVPFWRRPLAAVVADLHLGAKTGLLFVRGKGGAAVLSFEDGALVHARVNVPELRLDRMLAAVATDLTASQLSRLSALGNDVPPSALPDALLAEKLVSAEQIQALRADHMRQGVARAFQWTDGACHFVGSDAPRSEQLKLNLDVVSLVAWACRQMPLTEEFLRWLPRADRRIKLVHAVADVAKEHGLTTEEREFLGLCDGTRTLGKLRAIGRMLGVDADRILAALWALARIEATGGAEVAALPLAMGASVPPSGELASFAPAVLLATLHHARKTGVLEMQDPGGASRTVYLESGAIAFAMSNDPHDRLGQVLVRSNILSSADLDRALEVARENPGVALGRVLVTMKLLGPDDLHRALVLQVQQVVTGTVGWCHGTFRFHEGALPVRDIVPLGLDARQALLVAFRTCTFTDIGARLPQPGWRLRRTTACDELSASLPLDGLEDRLLLEVESQLTVQELAGRAPEGVEAVLRAIPCLIAMGLIESFTGEAVVRAPSAPALSLSDTSEGAANASPWQATRQSLPLDGGQDFDEDDAVSSASTPRESYPDLDLPLDAVAPPASRHDSAFALGPGEPATAAATSFSGVAAAVAEAPDTRHHPVPALSAFLSALAQHLAANPASVPAAVRELLPADLRELYRL